MNPPTFRPPTAAAQNSNPGSTAILQASFTGNQFRLPAAFGPAAAIQRFGGGAWATLPGGTLKLRPPGTGQPLPGTVQRKMEQLFRTDLSGVRIHIGPEAAAIGAVAFTCRGDIYFATGHFAPESPHGERLLAHELAHVVQQRSGRVRCPAGPGLAVVHDRGLEAEAERMGALAAATRSLPAAPRPMPTLSKLAPARPAPSSAGPVTALAKRAPGPGMAGTVQPFGWLAGKVTGLAVKAYELYEPHWRERQELERRDRETRELLAGLGPSVRSRAKVKELAQQLKAIHVDLATADEYVDLGNQLGNIAGGLRREAELVRRVEAGARYFTAHGRSRFEESIPGFGDIEQGAWNRIATLGTDIPKIKKRARAGNKGSRQYLVEYLFRQFLSAGFRYDIMTGYPSYLVGQYAGNDPQGNCLSFSQTFANVLISFGIEAEAKFVRTESQGRFIVRLDSFIDSNVRGHIYHKKKLLPGYFMFTSHAAVWVPLMGKYYDPMAAISYNSLKPYIDCELTTSPDDTEFRPKAQPKTLQPHRKWKLVRTEKAMRGGFSRLQLVDDDGE